MADDEEELLPEDDSVFDCVINQSLNQSSDAFIDDSFSSVIELTSTPVIASRKGRSETSAAESASPRRSARLLRSQSPGPSSSRSTSPAASDTISVSPRRSRRISALAQNLSSHPSTATIPSTEANISSPRRSQRTSSVAQPTSPRPSTSHIQLLTGRSAQPSEKSSGPKRIKCTECTATLANERTYSVHKKLHSLKRSLGRVTNADEFFEHLPGLVNLALQKLMGEYCVGTLGKEVHDVAESFRMTLENFNECHDELMKFLHGHLYPFLTDCKGVFSSSLSYVFYAGVNKLLNNEDFVCDLKKHILGIEGVVCSNSEIMNMFVASLLLHLNTVVIVHITKKIHGATANDEVRRKRSADKVDSETFLIMCYHIGGSVVSGFLFKGDKYRVTNPHWEAFYCVLKNKFLSSEGVGNKCADNITEFTRGKDRGGLKHISQEALDFFVVLFDLLVSLEGRDGSLPENVISENILESHVILCLWDVLTGNEIGEDSSLDFLMQMAESCRLIVMKGIMKRRLNDHLKKSYTSVSLRSRLAE